MLMFRHSRRPVDDFHAFHRTSLHLEESLEDARKGAAAAGSRVIDAAAEAELRSLGYVQ